MPFRSLDLDGCAPAERLGRNGGRDDEAPRDYSEVARASHVNIGCAHDLENHPASPEVRRGVSHPASIMGGSVEFCAQCSHAADTCRKRAAARATVAVVLGRVIWSTRRAAVRRFPGWLLLVAVVVKRCREGCLSVSSMRVRLVCRSWVGVDAVTACDSAWVAATAHRAVGAHGNGW